MITLLYIAAPLLILCVGLWILAFIPSRRFTPYSEPPTRPDYWPTISFQISSPEKQGMDSEKLSGISDYCQKKHRKDSSYSIDSIDIYRNGYNIASFCFNPLYNKNAPHIINSVTKSIISMLIGIAIKQGYIKSVDDSFTEYFPDKRAAIKDNRMDYIAIKDLLTMQTGIRSRDSAIYRWVGSFEMQHRDDWVSYIMGLPVDNEPGEQFVYSNMSSFLLSAIITEATGMDTLDFARKYLFNHLGIKQVKWDWSPCNYAIGFARMWLKPDDMAKLGLLIQQQGYWDGEQILPASWVRESLTPHAFPKNYVKLLDENGEVDNDLTAKNWRIANFFRPFSDGYGYQWWLDRNGSYTALGVGGQYIMVVPDRDLIVVVTSSSSGLGVFFPKKILNKYILPSIKSSGSIQENEYAYNKLISKSKPPELTRDITRKQKLPQIAFKISQKVFSLNKNNFGHDNLRLTFFNNFNFSRCSYTAKQGREKIKIRVGMDGVYQFSETTSGTFAARGKWADSNRFEMEIQHIGYSSPTCLYLTFEDDEITVEEIGIAGTYIYSGKNKTMKL